MQQSSMSKYPAVRIKQIKSNPWYLFFWLQRLFWYKKYSYQSIDGIKNLKQLLASQTLDYIIDNNKSLIRFGDGEFGLLSGAGIYPPDSDWSQKYSKKLKVAIERQLVLESEQILLAVPPKNHLLYKEGDLPELDVISSMHIEARLYFNDLVNPKTLYGDWSVFMPHHNKKLNWKKIGNYISDRNIVLVTGGTTKLQDIKLGKQTFFVECGKHNAFERLDQITDKVEELIQSENLQQQETLFWVSLGCSAGSLVETLSDKGYIAWDTGHIFRFAEAEIRKELV